MLIPNNEELWEDYCLDQELLGQYSIVSKGKKYIIQIGYAYNTTSNKCSICCCIYRWQKKYSWGVYACCKWFGSDNQEYVDEFYNRHFTKKARNEIETMARRLEKLRAFI